MKERAWLYKPLAGNVGTQSGQDTHSKMAEVDLGLGEQPEGPGAWESVSHFCYQQIPEDCMSVLFICIEQENFLPSIAAVARSD
jgi:hypothetical protein